MHAPYVCPPTICAISLDFCRKPSILEADDFLELLGACKRKAMTPKKQWALLRTSSTTTRDRNLQFRGAVSTAGSPLDFLLVLQYLRAI